MMSPFFDWGLRFCRSRDLEDRKLTGDILFDLYRGISFLLTSVLFHVVPTALEISMVCGILVSVHFASLAFYTIHGRFSLHVQSIPLYVCQSYNFGINFASVTLMTMIAYTWFTVRTTSWRMGFRREANKADNKAASVSVDSLINYEAVKVSLLFYLYQDRPDRPEIIT